MKTKLNNLTLEENNLSKLPGTKDHLFKSTDFLWTYYVPVNVLDAEIVKWTALPWRSYLVGSGQINKFLQKCLQATYT